MPYWYFNYSGRPARMTVDDKDIPELCEVWDPEQKKLVRDNHAETDLFFGVAGAMISEEEFTALLKRISETMSYRYFDWGDCPARVLFDGKRPVQCEIWDPFNGKLVVDEKNLFMESLGVDPELGLVDFQFVVSEEKFNALVQQRLAAMSEPPVHVSLTPKDGE